MEQENNVGLSGEGDTSFIFSKPEWFEIISVYRAMYLNMANYFSYT